MLPGGSAFITRACCTSVQGSQSPIDVNTPKLGYEIYARLQDNSSVLGISEVSQLLGADRWGD